MTIPSIVCPTFSILKLCHADELQDWEDKALVQISLQFQKEGIQITWSYMARLMTKSKRTGSELRLRLTSLKRTYSEALSRFPPCFHDINSTAVHGGGRPGGAGIGKIRRVGEGQGGGGLARADHGGGIDGRDVRGPVGLGRARMCFGDGGECEYVRGGI
ncbi:hypothetical protein GQ600_18421 [Phytophthora cactorum]|nr:hypothetical protein GQ600_18421 [Phytophthora cactorum]